MDDVSETGSGKLPGSLSNGGFDPLKGSKMKLMTRVWKWDAYDGMSFFGGLVFFAPVALLVRTQAGITEVPFFLLQALLSGVVALGELPTGYLTDRIGYRYSLILSQFLLLMARVLLMAAFLRRSLILFAAEAVVEGLSVCLLSGTDSAYLYVLYGEEGFLPKATHASNFGTAGFLISTAAYAVLYRRFHLIGLLAATVISGTAGFLCALFLPKEPQNENHAVRLPMRSLLKPLFKDKRTWLLVIMLSMFSAAWLLVNFFYAEKLLICDVPLTWLSAIIIGYSALQMLAEPVTRWCKKKATAVLPPIFCLLCGAALVAFGWVRSVWMVLPLMLLIPLLLDLAAFFLEERQNCLVDELEAGGNRATVLSTMNIGVNLVEIFSLFASSILATIGAGWCFALAGLGLICGALTYGRWYLSGRKTRS